MGRQFHKTADDGDFILAPEGAHMATLTVLAYLGKHQSTWQGQSRILERVGLSWELAERDGDEGRALAVTEVLNASLHEKSKLFARVLALTGGREPPEGFDLEKLLGHGAVVTVVHEVRDGRTWANVANVGGLPRGMHLPPPSVAPIYWDIEDPDPAVYNQLPARFRKLAETALGAAGPQPSPPPPQPGAPTQAAHAASFRTQAPTQPQQPPTAPPSGYGPPPQPEAGSPFDDDIPF